MDDFEEEEVDINALLDDMKKTDEKIKTVSSDFVSMLKDLTSADENIKRSLNDYIEMMN